MKNLLLALLAALGLPARAEVHVPGGIDHAPLEALLQRHVDTRGLVDYAGWRANTADRAQLAAYLAQYAPAPTGEVPPDERIASLINAYNAFTLELILDHPDIAGIRDISAPWTRRRHLVGGERVSLDDIEHATLRPLAGWRVHAVLVCAARSCPPLLDRAYTAAHWREQAAERFRAWLARPDLNTFDPARREVRISKIFDWYGGDFTGPDSVPNVLRRHGPPEHAALLAGEFRIRYLDYDWSLNDQNPQREPARRRWLGLFR